MRLDTIQVGEYFFEKFISKEQINAIVQRMAVEIDDYYKNILILEDIVETGNTLYHLTRELKLKAAASVRLASLFVKPTEIIQPLQVDFFGMEIGPEFIIGYGLDYNGFGRTYPDVYIKK